MILLRILKNKYFLTIVAMVVWLLFFDKNDVFTQYELIQKCKKLEKEKEYFTVEIENNKRNLVDLRTNTKSLETLSRDGRQVQRDGRQVQRDGR